MPTAITHALVGLGLGEVLATRPMPLAYHLLTMSLGALPDLDVLAFALGIPYGARFGHRGFTHSLCCALLTGVLVGLLTAGFLGTSWWVLGGYFFAVMASHGLLDAMTNGGLGIALLSPFDDTRYFFPWRPVQVSPLGRGFFSRWGLRALGSEVVWIWIPLAILVGAVLLVQTSP